PAAPVVGLLHRRRAPRGIRPVPARHRVHAADDRHRALRRGPLENLADRRHRARPRRADQTHGAGRRRRAGAEAGGRASADPRPVAAAVLRAHVLCAERRARRARHQLADRPALPVPDRSLAIGAPELTAYRIGFDVGGTFTDFVLQSPSGELTTGKRLTTYPDPSEACLAGLDALLAQARVSWRDIAQAVHGTTLGSNVVIERKARGVGLLTTRGFRDVLIIGREKRYQVYDLQIEKPAPLIPRRLIGEVTERVHADGSVRTTLDEADARRAIRELAARGGTTLAVCVLRAYLDPVAEGRTA